MTTSIAQLESEIAALSARIDQITTPSHAAIVAQMQALLTKWQAREDEQRVWWGGVAGGGPNNDGKYPVTDVGGYTRLVSCPDQMQLDASMLKVVELTGNGPFAMTVAQANRVVVITSPGNVSVVLPSLPIGTQFLFIQGGAGKLVFSADAGSQILHRQSFDRTAGKDGMTTAIRRSKTVWAIGGDMSYQ